MLEKPLTLAEQLQDEEDKVERQESFYTISYRAEKVFPVYAMGISNPDSDSVLASSIDDLDIRYDPIWDAVREEAKLKS